MMTQHALDAMFAKRRSYRILRRFYRKRCYYCGVRTTIPHRGERQKLTERTIDHVVPLSRGGKEDLSNKVLACLRCNREKADRDVMEFIEERVKRSGIKATGGLGRAGV